VPGGVPESGTGWGNATRTSHGPGPVHGPASASLLRTSFSRRFETIKQPCDSCGGTCCERAMWIYYHHGQQGRACLGNRFSIRTTAGSRPVQHHRAESRTPPSPSCEAVLACPRDSYQYHQAAYVSGRVAPVSGVQPGSQDWTRAAGVCYLGAKNPDEQTTRVWHTIKPPFPLFQTPSELCKSWTGHL
jgi:hypothetical protein